MRFSDILHGGMLDRSLSLFLLERRKNDFRALPFHYQSESAVHFHGSYQCVSTTQKSALDSCMVKIDCPETWTCIIGWSRFSGCCWSAGGGNLFWVLSSRLLLYIRSGVAFSCDANIGLLRSLPVQCNFGIGQSKRKPNVILMSSTILIS